MEVIGPELRFALRALRRSPTHTVVCITNFALVVGAAAGIFAALDAVLLAPLPYSDPSSVVFVGEQSIEGTGPAGVTSQIVLNRIAESGRTLRDVATFNIAEGTLTGAGDPVLLSGARVTWNYFHTLDRAPALGRRFQSGDGAVRSAPQIMISDRLWRQRFAADHALVGRSIMLSGVLHQVVGVMPSDFRAPDDYLFGKRNSDIWIAGEFEAGQPNARYLRGVARLRPGMSSEQVAAELDGVRQRLGQQYAGWAERSRIVALPLKDHVTRDVKPVLLLLGITAGLVLLIGCANLANLVLTRGLGRGVEIELRTALGAGRIAATRPLVLEVLLLGAAGALLGLLLAAAALGVLVAAAPTDLPRLDAIGINARVVLAAFALALTVAGLASLMPVWRLRARSEGNRLLAVSLRGETRVLVGLVLRQGSFIVGTGAALGLLLTLNGSRLIEGLLFGVRAHDPLTFAAATLFIAALALLACWRPAFRVSRIDPTVTLRGD